MNKHQPALIVTDPRCITSVLPHGIASSFLTHHLYAASRAADTPVEGQIAPESRITGDDYW